MLLVSIALDVQKGMYFESCLSILLSFFLIFGCNFNQKEDSSLLIFFLL